MATNATKASTQELNPTNVLQAPSCSLEQLCQQCQTLKPHRGERDFTGTILTEYERFDEYPNYPSLEETAARGCRMCGFLKSSLLAVQNRQSYEAEPNETHPFWGTTGEDVALQLPWDRRIKMTARFEYGAFDASGTSSLEDKSAGSTEQQGGMIVFMWLIYKPSSGNLRDDRGNVWGTSVMVFSTFDSIDTESPYQAQMRRLPSSQTLSAENVDLMRSWVRNCGNEHPHCLAPAKPWLPSRLIEITGTDESWTIRLAPMTDEHIANGSQYVALSHMWGDMTVSPPYRTFQSNFEQHKLEINEFELPQNFRDAISVSCALGVRLLWIDSLCIIQDSDEDWREQALQMHLVYRHAQVTIVATQASSSHDGFLQRDLELSRAIKIEYGSEAEAGERRSIMLCRHQSSKEGQRMHAIDGARWNTRGWTMQERSLSTRTIHFCRNKLFFECRGSLASEENEPPQEAELLSHVMWPRGESVSTQHLYANWELHVIEFCRRNLTNSRDKLPAIRSIAEEMSERTDMEYVACAGMWRPYFKRELLWAVAFGTASKPPVPRAPSWSWASLDAHTNFIEGLLHETKRSIPEPLNRLFEANTFEVVELYDPGMKRTAERNHFGSIRVKCLIKELDFRTEKLQNPGKWRNFLPVDFFAESKTDPKSERQVVAHGKFDLGDEVSSSGPLLYAHVGENSRITGLVLERVSDKHDLQAETPFSWRRVGVATLFEDEGGEPIVSGVLEDAVASDSLTIV